jgi:IS5 family transposase
MLVLEARPVEVLWDEVLPIEARLLPADLAVIDAVLCDPAVLEPIVAHWQGEAERRGRSSARHGRPTIAAATYVRLMVVKQRYGWGYERLVREVGDSLSLRRFCRIGLGQRVPDESTIRKLTRRLGPDVVAAMTRAVIAKGVRETHFRARAVRIDSTVVEADVRYPTDAGLAGDAVRLLAREGKRAAALVAGGAAAMRDRSRAVGRQLRALGRAVKRRTGEAKDDVLRLTGECGKLAAASVRDARRLAERLRAAARGRGAQAKLRAAARLEQTIELAEKVCEQIRKRLAGEPISDRLVSLADPDARPIRKGKAGKPTEFGSVHQIAEITPHTRKGARGFVLPPATAPGNPGEEKLLPATVAELERLGLAPAEVAVDGGFPVRSTSEAFEPLAPERLFIAGKRSTAAAGEQAHARPAGRLPHRQRGPPQPPQTRLRPAPQPPQGRRAHQDLGRLERLGLQPRHLRPLRRPTRLKASRQARQTTTGPRNHRDGRADRTRRGRFFSPSPPTAVNPGQVD